MQEELYLKNNDKLDKILYQELIPAFAAHNNFDNISLTENKSFSYYDDLSDNVKKMFRDLFYGQYKDLECTKEEFEELYCFLDFVCYNKKEFLPVFHRYLYNIRSDKEFMRKTAHIHKNQEYLDGDYYKMGCIILGISENAPIREVKSLADKNIPKAINFYAYCLLNGYGGSDDKPKARELLKFNWEQNKNADSLHMYAICLFYGYGGPEDKPKASELLKFNWEQNKNADSLHSYAICLFNGYGGPEDKSKASELFKFNWEQNKCVDSLDWYACCLFNSYGGPEDKPKARELFKFNWEQNKHANSLYSYAICLFNGYGGPEDKPKARELLKFNWEQNKHTKSQELLNRLQ